MSGEWVAVIAGVVVALVAAPLLILAVMADEDRGRHRADDDADSGSSAADTRHAVTPTGEEVGQSATDFPDDRMRYECSCGWTCVDDSGDVAGFDEAVDEHLEQHLDDGADDE